MAKHKSEVLSFKGGVASAIGPTEYGLEGYSLMNNVKLTSLGKLKKDHGTRFFGYSEKADSGTQTNWAPSKEILYIGSWKTYIGGPNTIMPVYTALDNNGTVNINRNLINITAGGTIDQLVMSNASQYPLLYFVAPSYATGQSDQEKYITASSASVIYTPLDLYMLSKNTMGNKIFKYDYNIWSLGMASYFPLDKFTPDHATYIHANDPYYDKMAAGDYVYFWTFVTDTGSETIASQKVSVTLADLGSVQVGGCNILDSTDGMYFWNQSGILSGAPTTIRYIRLYRSKKNDPYAFYRVAQIAWQQTFFTGVNMIRDSIPDVELTEQYIDNGLIEATGTCGCYENDRLHIGNGSLLYISQTTKLDEFMAEKVIVIPGATEANPITAVTSINSTIYVFLRTGIVALMKTGNDTTPYVVNTVIQTYGCDEGKNKCISASYMYDNGGIQQIIIFVCNGALYSFDGSNVVNIGTMVQPDLDLGDISLSYNDLLETIYVNIKNASTGHGIKLLCLSTRFRCFTSETRDARETGDGLATIDDIIYVKEFERTFASIYDPYLVNYDSHAQRIYCESTDYNFLVYPDDNDSYLHDPVAVPLTSTIIKPLYTPFRSRLSKVTLFGTSPWMLGAQSNEDPMTYIQDVVMTERRGVDVPLNVDGETYSVQIAHNVNAPIVLDYWQYTFVPLSQQGRDAIGGSRHQS